MRRLLTALTLLAALLAAAPALAQGSQTDAQKEVWSGATELPGGGKLELSITINRGDEPRATIDIPAQGAVGVPLEIVSLEEDSFALKIPAPANALFEGSLNDDGEMTGVLKQAGMEFPFTLTRAEDGAPTGPPRPQHPEPPFPYDAEDVEIENAEDGVTLAGTLTLPEGDGPFPAAVLLSGSGPQDRDETLVGHKPFLVIADHLTRNGIAVLRYDDRGFGASTGDFASAVVDDFVTDALAARDFAADHPRIDPGAVGLVGHSEGGLVAPMAAAQNPDIAFIVCLAPVGVPGDEVLVSQQVALTRAAGAPQNVADQVGDAMQRVVDAIKAGGDRDAVRAPLRDVLALQNPAATPDSLDAIVDSQIGFFASDSMARFIEIDPADYFEQLAQPVLALFGEIDRQVVESVNVPPIDRALDRAPTGDVTILVYPGLNHLFQTAASGSTQEYAQIEETFSPKALEALSSWINARF